MKDSTFKEEALEKTTLRADAELVESVDAPSDATADATAGDETTQATANQEQSDQFPNLGERFEVLARIGSGGMGSVYKVKDVNIDAVLAVKVLQQNLVQDQAALKRFEQEAEAAQKLSHPNLVPVYDHGTTVDGAPYIVMDYLEGRALSDILNDSQTLDSKRAIKIFRDICDALSYAHKQGVIHRDIKPTNIIVTDVGQSTERAHIVDFGIAKVLPTANRETHDLTQTGEIFGSPHYMSPEQCLGFMLDNRSDIYSLGCLMYECLTGGAPFEGANPIQVVVKHINEEPAEFSRAAKVDRHVEKLESVVMRCLDKEKTERYQHVDDIVKDLTAIETGKPIVRYARNARVKPMFTKRQTLGILVVFVGVTIYGTILSMTINSEVGGKILGGLIGGVCLAGVYVFYSAALEVFKKRIKVLTESNAWRMLLLISLGTGSLTALQYPAIVVLGYNHLPHEEIFRQLFFMVGLIHISSLVSCLISGLGCLVFRSPKKFNPLVLGSKFVGLAVVVCLFCQFVVPKETGKGLAALGNASTREQPAIARTLFELAYYLDNTAKDRLENIAELNHTLGNHTPELAYYENIATNNDNYYRLADLAMRFKTHGMPDKAMKLIDSAVASAQSRTDGLTLARNLVIRANYHKENNDLRAAQKDYREAIKADPHDETAERTLAQIDCILGDYQEAVVIMDKLSNRYGNEINDRVLAGILFDHLGNTARAKKLYQEIVDLYFKTRTTNFPAATEFAIHRLGLPLTSTYDHKPMSAEEKAGLWKTLGIENSKLPINW